MATLVTPLARAATDPGWQSSVTRAIADGEYHLSLNDATGAFTAPNRAHDFRTRWSSDGGFTLESRTDAKAWSFSYRLLGVGRGDALTLPEVRHENVSDGRIEWQRDGLREWYVNDARGVEQGFVLESRPGGDARQPVVIEGVIDGLLAFPASDGQSVLFRTHEGRDAMRMRDLSVVDAAGRVVTSCFEVGVGVIALVIDDRSSLYPLTIDPLMTSPAWEVLSDQPDSDFASSVAAAGDVNGDGYSDVVVGAFDYDNGETGEGRAFVYMGSAIGLAITPVWTAESDQEQASFGHSVATAGDVNGDGYADVIVGAHRYDNDQGDEGRAYVYFGSASGLGASPTWMAEGNQDFADFGQDVSTAGDVNGDGHDDVVVGAFLYDNGELNEGAAFVYLGSAAGLEANAVWTAEGNQSISRFGTSVASAGDVNGDGYDDVMVGAPQYDNDQLDEGRALVYLGLSSGLSPIPTWTGEGDQTDSWFGYAVATAGDVNGDGYGDVIVGSSGYDNGEDREGRASVYLGSAAGLAAIPAWTVESNHGHADFGRAVATAGDVNGDGYADVIVGAPVYDNGESDEGAAFVYLGSGAGLGPMPVWIGESNRVNALYGSTVATAGDVNGDGYSDVIVGSESASSSTVEGHAYVYHGSASGLAAVESWTAESNQEYSNFGWSVATAGDVNGDGHSDVIVAAPDYDNGELDEGAAFLYLGSAAGLSISAAWTAEGNQPGGSCCRAFGASVASAGDVNGDGYSDVIVGAPLYDNGERWEGRALLYLGSATGLAAVAAWTAESDQSFSGYGSSVATAGDVNGDGYSDVAVGASGFANGEVDEGRAYLYSGSALGLSASPVWIAEGDQTNARFGWSVATAGDVNGDGYSDVICGAPNYGSGGRVFVYLGSASGLGGVAWSAASSQADSQFGSLVATVGDVDGDGYSDVIIGASEYDNGEPAEGRAYVYLGSPFGLGAADVWTAEGDQDYARFGHSAATAGDVNGDGYSDVIVGAAAYGSGGRAFVYMGSPSGLASTPAWTAESNQIGAHFGWSVATAGDVNGDGYSDVIVGAVTYDNGEYYEGRAFLYYGNDGDGLDRIPRQARADGSAPIDLLGGTLSTDGFRLRANGRSPFGRDQVRLEWEVKPVATPFDGADIRRSNWFDTGAPGANGSVVPLDELHAPLAGPGPFHWRLRLRSRSPFPWQSHWMSLPYNAITETDLRTENSVARCDLAYADLTFPPIAPVRVAPWVYTDSCASGDVLPTLLLPAIVSGSDIDTLGGSPGTLRFYQLSCGCAYGIKLTKRMGNVNLSTF